ncbi:NIPSNAP family protein [Enterobacteriaceae bacterium H11S18]|uniref:NIPSNAP family protein n=1 Tax=Dryocola clanedunensis TaxID=2925396 RepID=UPI0022F0BA57|nr:NIPSNAP family protein [Dryocola clanedunensis]MCT4709230.1 NIPSNAP family protein [Dryocola clanedunensis]
MRTVEILLYTLKKGTGKKFHKIMVEQSAPLHRASGIDIVSFGNSTHDEDSYYLIRSFDDPAHMKLSQGEFYSSDAWINGPRTEIIERIETSVKSVLILGAKVVDNLRM